MHNINDWNMFIYIHIYILILLSVLLSVIRHDNKDTSWHFTDITIDAGDGQVHKSCHTYTQCPKKYIYIYTYFVVFCRGCVAICSTYTALRVLQHYFIGTGGIMQLLQLKWSKAWIILACKSHSSPGPLFTKRRDVLLQDLMKSRSRDIRINLDSSNRSKIWKAARQQSCRDACQISERYDHHDIRGFDIWR